MATIPGNECLPAADIALISSVVRQSTMGSLLHYETASICTALLISSTRQWVLQSSPRTPWLV